MLDRETPRCQARCGVAVSAPFHSSCCNRRAIVCVIDLRSDAEKTAHRLINNVDVSIESEPRRIADALARQAASPVRWADTIRKMSDLGVTHVIECGPGRVLSGLTKRIAPNLEVWSLTTRPRSRAH